MEHAGNVSHKNVILTELGFPSYVNTRNFASMSILTNTLLFMFFVSSFSSVENQIYGFIQIQPLSYTLTPWYLINL